MGIRHSRARNRYEERLTKGYLNVPVVGGEAGKLAAPTLERLPFNNYSNSKDWFRLLHKMTQHTM